MPRVQRPRDAQTVDYQYRRDIASALDEGYQTWDEVEAAQVAAHDPRNGAKLNFLRAQALLLHLMSELKAGDERAEMASAALLRVRQAAFREVRGTAAGVAGWSRRWESMLSRAARAVRP
jgi:hypothetical protein